MQVLLLSYFTEEKLRQGESRKIAQGHNLGHGRAMIQTHAVIFQDPTLTMFL